MTEKKTCDNCRLKAFCFIHGMTPRQWAIWAEESEWRKNSDCIYWGKKKQTTEGKEKS